MNRLRPALPLLLLLLPLPTALADEVPSPVLSGMVPEDSPLVRHLAQTVISNPDVQAALETCRAAGFDTDAVRLSFEAPALIASAGVTEDPGDVPFSSASFDIPANAASAQAGVEAPLVSGVYGGAGASYRALRTAGDDDGDDSASAGARLRIPLLRDRGFAVNRLDVGTLTLEESVAAYSFQSALQDALTSVVGAYANVLFRVADAAEVSNALARAEQLVEDATARAELEDVAEYQVFPARYEAATRQEELAEARTQILVARKNLLHAIGAEPTDDPFDTLAPEAASDALSDWTAALNAADISPLLAAEPEKACPEVLAAEAAWQAERSRVSAAKEAEKSSLDLLVGAGWQSEENSTTLHDAGYGVSLVFSRPLSRDGSRAKIEAASARAAAASHAYAAAILAARVRHDKAVAALESARGRCRLALATVEAARRVLDAENERFSIGEGSSRNVLDAQKDLTTARRRALSVSLEVVSAMAELYRACGISPFEK